MPRKVGGWWLDIVFDDEGRRAVERKLAIVSQVDLVRAREVFVEMEGREKERGKMLTPHDSFQLV